MRRFTILRNVIGFLRKQAHPLVEEILLDQVLQSMSSKACANAVFTALAINPDPSYWRFTNKKQP